jgi:hypothetical protein
LHGVYTTTPLLGLTEIILRGEAEKKEGGIKREEEVLRYREKEGKSEPS